MLEARQIRFCEEYITDLNATRAAKAAGYSEATAAQIAHNNLQKPEIKAYIEKRQNELIESLQLTQEWVILRFKEISDRSMQAEPVLDKDGNPTGEYKYDSAGANKATEMIGKHLGMFTTKVDVTSLGKSIANPTYVTRQGDAPPLTEDETDA